MIMHNLIVLDAQLEKVEYIHVQESKVNEKNSETDTIRTTSSPRHQTERQANTIKQQQTEQMASRIGNSFKTFKEKVGSLLHKLN